VARFSNPAQQRLLEAAGARTIAFDLAEHDLSPLPRSVDVVINYAVLPPNKQEHYDVNAGAVGRLARRYRDCEAFVQGSTGSLCLSGRARETGGAMNNAIPDPQAVSPLDRLLAIEEIKRLKSKYFYYF